MLFIFDWDGTVCDSAAKIVDSMQKSAEDAGVQVLSSDEIKNIIGLGLPEAVQTLYPDQSEQKQEEIRSGYSRHYLNKDQGNPTPLFEGALETLHMLADKGFHLAVATGKSRKGLDRILKEHGLENFFHSTRCADETASKPHPLMLEELLRELDVPVEQAVMVGDTEFDMAMAEAIGMPRIAVSYGAHHIDRLRKYQPALCVDEFATIAAYSFVNETEMA